MADYTAGRLLVAVVPDMRGAGARIRKEFSGIGPYDVPITAKVDRKQLDGLRVALRSLPDVVVDANTSAADREIAALRGRIMALSDAEIGVNMSAADARREIAEISVSLDRLATKSPDIAVRVDAAAAQSALQGVDRELAKLSGRQATIKVDADTQRASIALRALDAVRSGLDRTRTVIQVGADVGNAIAKLYAVQVAVSSFIQKPINLKVSADTAAAAAAISRMIALVGALTVAAGGLAGVLGGAVGALGGLGAAGAVAGGGLLATLVGFRGVGGAVKALGEQQKSAGATAKASAAQQKQAAEQVAAAQTQLGRASQAAGRARSDAERDVGRAAAEVNKARAAGARSVADAEQSASRSILEAKKAVGMASRQYDASVRATRMAQQDLTRAWEDGKRALQDLQDQLDMSLIDQRQAALDLKDAKKALDEARASGDADAIERASIAYDRQRESVDQLGKRTARLQTDNAKGQAAGVKGTEQYTAALQRVQSAEESQTNAGLALADARANVRQAEADGAAQVADARRAASESIEAAEQRLADQQESSRRSIEQADLAVIDAQKALQKALESTADSADSAGDKVKEAFADLSPEAAAFARYLFSLKPILDGLSASAAAGLFPPLTKGLQDLVATAPLLNKVVGQLASGMGVALGGVLTQLASPFWQGFFAMLGNAAGSVIPGLFNSLMTLARAAATLITALMPLAPVGFMVLDAISGLISYLAPFLASSLGGMVPATMAFLEALRPLGPLLDALSPILNALGIAFSQVLGALLTALTPILIALTPLFVAFAQAVAGSLIGSIQAAMPFLLGLATWLGQNPGLVISVITAVMALTGALRPLAFVGGLVLAWLARMAILGAVGALLTRFGLAGTFAGRAIMLFLQPLQLIRTTLGFVGGLVARVAGGPFALLRTVIMWIGRAILTALGPIGILITILGLLYTSSQPFKAAVDQLFSVLGQVVGLIVSAVMPIFNALSGVLSMLAGVFGGLVQQLAAALVPVINMVTGVLVQLVQAVLPPLMSIINSLLPIIGLLGGIFGQLMGAVSPILGAFTQLYAQILPPVMAIIQALLPVVEWLAGVLAGALTLAINYLVIPALKLIMWVITTILIPAITWLVSMVVPAFQAIGAAASWLWTNVISPVFNFIGLAARILFAVLYTVLIAPLLIAWNWLMAGIDWAWQNILKPCWDALMAAASWLYYTILNPIFILIGASWDALMRGIDYVWQNILKPCWLAIQAGLNWLYYNVWLPLCAYLSSEWDRLMRMIDWLWINVLKPVWDAITAGLNWLYYNVWLPLCDYIGKEWDRLMRMIDWVWLNVLKPCFDAVSGGLTWLRDRFNDAVGWIRDIWNRLRGYLAAPINFMIRTVWNDGIRVAWNKVAGLVGLGEVDPLKEIPEAATGGIPYPDRYTPGRDIGLAAISGGESVMRPEWTRAMGTDYVHGANAAARAGGVQGVRSYMSDRAQGNALQHAMRTQPLDDAPKRIRTPWMGPFAYGGVAPHVAAAGDEIVRLFGAMPGGIGGRGSRGNESDHPSGFALDFMTMADAGLGNRVAAHLEQNAERMAVKYLIWQQRINQGRGWSGMEDRGSPTANHFDHVHASFEGGPLGGSWGDAGGGGGWFNWIRERIIDAFDLITNPALKALDLFTAPAPPAYNDVPQMLGTKMRDTLRDFLVGKSETQVPSGGPGAEQWRGVALEALRRTGQDPGLIDRVLQQIQIESSGDPNIVNTWDINAQRGTPSKGLIQTIDSTFQAYRDPSLPNSPFDPLANLVAGIRYTIATYGSIAAKWPTKGGYDLGGIARGKGIMFKDVIDDERVLNPQETESYDRLGHLADMIEAGRARFGPSGPDSARIDAMLADRLAGAASSAGGTHLHVHGDVVEPVNVDSLMHAMDFASRGTTV